jgi:hypothetical protein
MLVAQIFLFLQVLDYLTTLIGFQLGASEASPFVAKLIHATSPEIGVALSKMVGIGVAGIAVATGRTRLIQWASYWYAGLVVWNLCIILHGLTLVRALIGHH